MAKSTVYFTDFRCPVGTSQLDKLRKLCIAAGIKDIDMDGKFVAIKMQAISYRLQYTVSGKPEKCVGASRLCEPEWI